MQDQSDNDEARLVVEIEPTREACAGSAAAYLLRKIAANAGSYAPGIEERMFAALDRVEGGLPSVEGWLWAYQDQLSYLGYQFVSRRVAFRTSGIVDWVGAGSGYRGALLPTDGQVMHPDGVHTGQHAIALIGSTNGAGVTMVDPWPGVGEGKVPANLDAARRGPKWSGLLLFWSGYS